MVDWLAGKRVKGTSSERTTSGFAFTPAVSGGWVELARTTLGSNSNNITVSSLPNKRYYMILTNIKPAGSHNPYMRLGSGGTPDNGSNYSDRTQYQGGADVTYTSQTYYNAYSGGSPYNSFWLQYIANYSTKEKLSLMHGVLQDNAGTTNVPLRYEVASKWANTSNAIDVFQLNNTAGGNNFASGSEVVVLGWDPLDSHTNNYWQELASVDLSGGASDTISSGTITAKKYLWVQAWVQQSSSNIRIASRFNSDTGSNYAFRDSENGGADSTATSQTYIKHSGSNAYDGFINMFIINNQSNEKLVICHYIGANTAGAGNIIARHESVGKWINTSQITNVSLYNDQAGDFGTGTIMKVWGAD